MTLLLLYHLLLHYYCKCIAYQPTCNRHHCVSSGPSDVLVGNVLIWILSSVLLCLPLCYSRLTLPHVPCFPPRYVWSRVYRMNIYIYIYIYIYRLKLCQRIWIGFEHGKKSVKKSLSLSHTITHTHTHLKDKAGDILYFSISLTNPMNAAIYSKKTKTHEWTTSSHWMTCSWI